MEEMTSPPFVGRHSPKAPLLGEFRPQEAKGGRLPTKGSLWETTPFRPCGATFPEGAISSGLATWASIPTSRPFSTEEVEQGEIL